MRKLPTLADRGVYGETEGVYKRGVPRPFHLGDLIRVSREERRWSQERLGAEAAKFALGKHDGRINKTTVNNIEQWPYDSGFHTVVRLMATLGLTFCEAEKHIRPPIPHIAEPQTVAKQSAG